MTSRRPPMMRVMILSVMSAAIGGSGRGTCISSQSQTDSASSGRGHSNLKSSVAVIRTMSDRIPGVGPGWQWGCAPRPAGHEAGWPRLLLSLQALELLFAAAAVLLRCAAVAELGVAPLQGRLKP